MTFRKEIKGQKYSVLAIALFGVAGLGAKGCDRAVVGEDDGCHTKPNERLACTGGDAGTSSGGSSNAGSGGGAGKGGSAGSASAGRGSGGSGHSGSTGQSGSVGQSGDTATGGADSGDGTCGGLLGTECAHGEFCNFPLDAICGAADAPGVCAPIPDICPTIADPVCGCDDVTYGNACVAAANGVSVASDGACEPDGGVCGGLRGAMCVEGEYCDFPPGAICGFADATGTCRPKPEACDAIYAPVCGCNGETYGNSCEAAMAGWSVESEGECDAPEGDICGGLTGAGCEAGQFCDFAPEAQCGAADQTGICEPIPDACPTIDEPVCGCDGVTYSNACIANQAEVSVAATGACETEPVICGTIQGLQCPDENQFCYFTSAEPCGNADFAGTCLDIPRICTTDDRPVCGCDGVTYSNECSAHAAGENVLSEGECPR